MRYKTHVATSMAGGAIFAKILSIPFTVFLAVGIALGSLLPDIDEPKSFIGRKLFFIAYPLKKIMGHRGLTHSLLACAGLYFLYSLYPSSFSLGLFIGYACHIVGDFFSVRGVPLLLPFTKQRVKAPITYRTGGKGEIIILLLGFGCFLGVFILGGLLQSFLLSIWEIVSFLEYIIQ
ncbi:MAG: metal-dependent hydrolase [Bacillus sp. (in: Bacteria)]|nr:metal-dependent hydrolase [Bacillus sp. (in: firmicutes)]